MSIKIENVVLPSPQQWMAVVRGMRNPMNSWDKSDSYITHIEDAETQQIAAFEFFMGEEDHKLAMRLAKAGKDHRKFMRMIPVFVDIVAPLYLLAELDTYKIGTVRNSCSFMHKGVSKPFEITDFSVKDERIYKVLTPLRKKTYELEYPYETDEYKIYTDHNGRTYRVYRNGLVIREAFDYVDNYGTGRTRHFDDDEAVVYRNSGGYFVLKLSGRNGGHISLHKLVAMMWCPKPEHADQVNHIDGNKGNNCAENLEWVTASENMQHAVDLGLYNELGGLHQRYRLWKNWDRIIPIEKRLEFKRDCDSGMTYKALAEKWDITPSQANNVRTAVQKLEYEELFNECYVWEKTLEQLNYMRASYLETKDEQVFQAIRCLLPSGYLQRSTFTLNYEVLSNIYHSRKNHRLDEWRTFCEWIESLPYSELITCGGKPEVLYICDGEACGPECPNIDCMYTSDIKHAIHFHAEGEFYMEDMG